jgi:hypothetical protein
MPKPMNDRQRSYVIVKASGGMHDFGRYLGMEPRDAARKVVRYVFRMLESQTVPKDVLVQMREVTRWEERKDRMFFFKGSRIPKIKRVELKSPSLEIISRFVYHVDRIDEIQFQAGINQESKKMHTLNRQTQGPHRQTQKTPTRRTKGPTRQTQHTKGPTQHTKGPTQHTKGPTQQTKGHSQHTPTQKTQHTPTQKTQHTPTQKTQKTQKTQHRTHRKSSTQSK